jgi:hypothetical protein
MNVLNSSSLFNFSRTQKHFDKPPHESTSIYLDPKFTNDRTLLAKIIENTILTKIRGRAGSSLETTDAAAIRDISREKKIDHEEALDLFLVGLIELNLDSVKKELAQYGADGILSAQATDLAALLLDESAAGAGQYREILLRRLIENY